MKNGDWGGSYSKPLLAICFNPKAGGVDFKIRAKREDEAIEKVKDVLTRQHKKFLDKCHGEYQLRFSRILTHPNAH